jgi:hypothetical protein
VNEELEMAQKEAVVAYFKLLSQHLEELHNMYGSPSIIRIIKSRRMRRAGYVARMGRRRRMHIGRKETTRKT